MLDAKRNGRSAEEFQDRIRLHPPQFVAHTQLRKLTAFIPLYCDVYADAEDTVHQMWKAPIVERISANRFFQFKRKHWCVCVRKLELNWMSKSQRRTLPFMKHSYSILTKCCDKADHNGDPFSGSWTTVYNRQV